MEKKQEKTLNFLSNNSFLLLSLFLCSPPPCSRTSLAARTLIEMCKSLWHRMNRQLLAGCPVPLCALPLNWSAPVCLPSSLLLPTLAAARFRLTSKARLRVPAEGLKPLSRADPSQRKRGTEKSFSVVLLWVRSNQSWADVKLTKRV